MRGRLRCGSGVWVAFSFLYLCSFVIAFFEAALVVRRCCTVDGEVVSMTRSLRSLLGSNRDSWNVSAGFEKRAPEFNFITSDAVRLTKLSIILSGSPIQCFPFAGIAQIQENWKAVLRQKTLLQK
jgi:hypothetical protein